MRARSLALCIAGLAALSAGGAHARTAERARERAAAARVEITRDDWGIAHIHGRSDADAVFGMAYAEAEDDFGRVEANYLTALGRRAEVEGDGALMSDLRARLYNDEPILKRRYAASPPWLRRLMTAWADGLNAYLASHPNVRPKAITRFEPWMPLAFSEGSIGGDIESIPLDGLARLYAPGGRLAEATVDPLAAAPLSGSNGIAIAPQNTRDGHALLLINPHTSYYFRSEQQVTSDEGLDAYGAATWGQFFIYQGFNDRVGWMHTSSRVDRTDFFREAVERRRGALWYRFGDAWRRAGARRVRVLSRSGGRLTAHVYTAWFTVHGPVVGVDGDRLLSVSMMDRPVEALEQGFLLTKARNFSDYMKVMALRANSSNNTVYADADGTVAYLHPQFVPVRDDQFDYSRPVDGADPATAWRGLHDLASLPMAVRPSTGWIQNTNNWPYSSAGAASPKASDFPKYMDDGYGENVRGVHAVALLTARHDFTLEGLMAAAYDPALPGFQILIPRLLSDYDALPKDDPRRAALGEPIGALRAWDERWAKDSVATSIAVAFGEALWAKAGLGDDDNRTADYERVIARTTPDQRLAALSEAGEGLARDFGTWRTPWGEINRFQRLTDDLVQQPSDAAPSLPVGFTSAQWGSLASIEGRRAPGVKRRYGEEGNSFVAVVEFGPRVRALAVTAGGESGDPASPHFKDQAERFADGRLRPVYFHPDELKGHVERTYHPRTSAD